MTVAPSSPDSVSVDSAAIHQTQVILPGRLQQEAKWAVSLLFGSWCLTSFLVFLVIDLTVVHFLALLPGLLMASYLAWILFRSLQYNHPQESADNLYPTLGGGNWISLVRAALIVVLFCLLPLTLNAGPPMVKIVGWCTGSVYLVSCLFDLLDGYVARRQQRLTELGKILDIETDAAGLMAAIVVAFFLGRLPVLYLVVSLSYYLFMYGRWYRSSHNLPLTELVQRPYGRIIAGCQMGLVALVLLPVFSKTHAHLAAAIFMIPFLFGFIRDWLVVSCRIHADAHQHSTLEVFFSEPFHDGASIVARMFVSLSGVYLIITHQLFLTNMIWSLCYTACLALIVIGFLGRTAALALIILVGLNLSPVGDSLIALVHFSGAAVLFLSGSGPLSLWAPEENILYRRSTGSIPHCEA